MRLVGLHSLTVDEAKLVEKFYLVEAEETTIGGNRKNEGTPIAKAYKSSNLPQQQIAKKVGVHPSTISRYKSKKEGTMRRPSFNTLKKLASVVGARATAMFPELGGA